MTPHATSTADERAARAAAALIESAPDRSHTLPELAEEVGVGASRLRRAFTAVFGMTPAAYARTVRVGKLREGLKGGAGVSQAGYDAGFGSDRAIYEHGTRGLAMAPSVYGQGGRGMSISYTVVPTSLGSTVVGATAVGVCCVLFADDVDQAAALLNREFPNATIERDDASVSAHAQHVRALIDRKPSRTAAPSATSKDIPLDLVGTPFQRAVWAELRRIPAGTTLTYAQLAERVGRPTATRAVANACGSNHAAVIVPCHRIVRTDGGLGGYKWGVGRKCALLGSEGAQPVSAEPEHAASRTVQPDTSSSMPSKGSTA